MVVLWIVIGLGLLIGLASVAGKHKTVKAIDVAGLNFLTPIVRLCYGEEPEKQIRDITRFILVPLLAIAIFTIAWYGVSERIYTKSGKLPNPQETWESASSIWAFHTRENDKQRAFDLTGEARDEELKKIEARLEEIGPLEQEINQGVSDAKAAAEELLNERLGPIQARYDKLKADYKEASEKRIDNLELLASETVSGSEAKKNDYIDLVREHRQQSDREKQELRELNASIKEIRDKKNPDVESALLKQTAIAEERQYLGKMRDQLTKSNREEKIAKENVKLESAKEKFYAADADSLIKEATNIVRTEDRITKIAESGYAKPATLPYQVYRSVLCVFAGFLLGSAIAIPIGILCGLSKTFMAAMTPFIAIFKPVSPIVWLPVALIIASAFIPDPDKHWFTQWMWDLPWLGQYKINPAFIASAVTVALCSLWATMVNTAFGVASVDKDHINVAKVLRLGFWSRLFKIVLPSALPLVFAGLRISLGVGWMVLIAAELLSSSEGIGKFVWDQFNNGASDSFAKMVVVVFVVGVIGLALDRMMIVFQRLVSFDGAPTAI